MYADRDGILYDTPADAIAAEYHLDGSAPPQEGGLHAVVQALSVVERHLHPLSPEQLKALLFIKHLGPERYRALADDYLAMYSLQAGPEALLAALEAASLVRAFRGYSASVQSDGLRGPRSLRPGRGRL